MGCKRVREDKGDDVYHEAEDDNLHIRVSVNIELFLFEKIQIQERDKGTNGCRNNQSNENANSEGLQSLAIMC